MTHIYIGNGKGKTTASIGLAVRAIGCGNKVLFTQFLKKGTSGEISVLKNLGATVKYFENLSGFTFRMTDEQKAECQTANEAMMEFVMENQKEFQLVVLDEVLDAINAKLLDEKLLVDFLQNKDESIEVVITGRNPSEKLLSLADYVTEMKKISHPYDKGIGGRKGIEF